MTLRLSACAVALTALAVPAMANDTTAQLGTGGLIFVTNQDITMASEDLSISREQIKVVYEFENTSDEDKTVLVAFPMPDIQGSGDFMVAVPSDTENLFEFATTFEGEPVDAELHQYVFQNNIEYTKLLTDLGVPLVPFGQVTQQALNELAPEDQQKLVALGLVFAMEYDAGEGEQTDYVPIWTLRSTYSWEATFPAGETVDVVHTYKPSVGGTVATTFMSEPDEYQSYKTEYTKKYCMDDAFLGAVRKTMKPGEDYSAPYYEQWLSYIWSTGNNWGGPIGKFTLTVDKGETDNLISFCGENVKKIGPTTFQMTATDWYPPWNQELEILILQKMEPYTE